MSRTTFGSPLSQTLVFRGRPDKLPAHDRATGASPMKGRLWLAAVVVGATLGGLLTAVPRAHAVPAPEVEFIYDITVRRQYSFASAADAINYAHGICDKLANGAGYAQVMGDVKNDVRPNDEYSANYLVTNAVNIFCPAQIWQLRNSAGNYVPPPA